MEKRGVSNIEFVLAFVLFISFVMIALYFFNPTKNIQTMELSKYYVFNQIVKNATVELDAYSVVINDNAQNNEIVAIKLPAQNMPPRAEDYSGAVLPSKRNGDWIYVNRKTEKFVLVKFSEEFTKGEGTISASAPLDESFYRLASSVTDNVISEKKMLYLNDSYYRDYQTLKKQLNTPNKIEFAFRLVFSDSYAIAAEKAPIAGTEIFSESRRVEVLRADESSAFADLTITIW